MNYNVEEDKCEQTIGSYIGETFKVMQEMKCVLDDFASIVNGSKNDDKTPAEANCLRDEARRVLAQADENLQRLLDIKGSVI